MTLTRQQKKQKKKQIEQANKKLSVLTAQMFDAVDYKIKQHIENDPDLAADISCKKGCAACCTQMVKITIPEAAHIATTYPELVHEVMPEIQRQADAMTAM